MKRIGNLMPKILEMDNLLSAYYKAVKGKRCKKSVILFSSNLYENLLSLRDSIISGTFEVGHYHYFKIYDPKERLICAASFEERVLHHAVMNICHGYFERHLIFDTYATRKGKGIYSAIERARKGMKTAGYVAKLDVRKYFDSISHNVLKKKLERLFKDNELIDLLNQIIDSYSVSEGRGIPIGNLTSQYFANFYLSFLDHYAKEELKIPVYVRYMDDILVMGENKSVVKEYVAAIKNFVETELMLKLKPEVLSPIDAGVSFLGYSIYKNKILLNRRSKIRFKKKLQKYGMLYERGEWTDWDYVAHIMPLLSFVEKAYTKSFRNRMMEKLYS